MGSYILTSSLLTWVGYLSSDLLFIDPLLTHYRIQRCIFVDTAMKIWVPCKVEILSEELYTFQKRFFIMDLVT
jgi:hypothetical protein